MVPINITKSDGNTPYILIVPKLRFNIWRMKNDSRAALYSLIVCVYVSSYGLLSLSGRERALPCWRNSWQIPYKEVHMLSMLVANILVESIRILAEGILADGILAVGRRTKNCDSVDNPLGRLGLNLDKTKRHPMERCMED